METIVCPKPQKSFIQCANYFVISIVQEAAKKRDSKIFIPNICLILGSNLVVQNLTKCFAQSHFSDLKFVFLCNGQLDRV